MNSRLQFSLTQLEYIVALHRYGHFAKAAKACRVTQPTLSMQIHKLEEELGVVLFDRTKKPILLTDAGARLIDQFHSVLGEAQKIEGLIKKGGYDALAGVLTLGVIPTIAPYLLPKLLPTLEKLYPRIELKIFELQTHRIIEALDHDEIEVGILATPLGVKKITERVLYYEPFSFLGRKDHPLSKNKKIKHSALASADLWLLQEGHCLRNQVIDVCSLAKGAGGKKKYSFESGSLETLKNLVNSYGGYTLMPYLASDHIGSNSTLLPLERPIPAREIGLVFRREHHKDTLIEALSDAILKCIPDELRRMKPKDLEVLPVTAQ